MEYQYQYNSKSVQHHTSMFCLNYPVIGCISIYYIYILACKYFILMCCCCPHQPTMPTFYGGFQSQNKVFYFILHTEREITLLKFAIVLNYLMICLKIKAFVFVCLTLSKVNQNIVHINKSYNIKWTFSSKRDRGLLEPFQLSF